MSGGAVISCENGGGCLPSHIQIQGHCGAIIAIDNDGFFIFLQIQSIAVDIGFGKILNRDQAQAIDCKGTRNIFDFKEFIVFSRRQCGGIFERQRKI